MKRMLILTLACLGMAANVRGQRLPDTVLPESYDLTFEPNLTKATFSGDETIHVKLLKPAATVVLNAAELAFQETSISAGGATQNAVVSLDPAKSRRR